MSPYTGLVGPYPRDPTTGALLIGARQYDRDDGQAGMYCTPMGGLLPLAAASLAASRAYAIRFVPSRNMTVVSMAFAVAAAAGADDACDVGIFSGNWQTLLGSAGATTGKLNSIGSKTVTLAAPVALVARTAYYAAFSCGTFGGVAGQLVMTNVNVNAVQLFGATAGTQLQSFQSGAHPLAAPHVSAGTIVSVPLLAVRES
jgi:hypothetical protein